ncbi:PH domain-containing protein [Microbacterium sp. NPDC056234]|uniref:PH domain-containing protein n=1 Tax=Microbacterium sp. NPDC056234 TaxID=3345757 RepID=UPI0035DA1C89
MTDSQTTPPQEPTPGADPGPTQSPALDQGTYTGIREPRGEGRLALDGQWHQISPRYVTSQFVQNAIFIAVVVMAALVLSLVLHQAWAWIPAGVIVVVTLITLVVLPRQAKAIGYMLRTDDIVFRKGILWQRMIAVPYGRMQLVDITHGPLDRAFGVSQLKMVTAAATTGVQIPGLSQAAAEALRDTLIEVAETRRTGL